jgi:hypothetical protein
LYLSFFHHKTFKTSKTFIISEARQPAASGGKRLRAAMVIYD